MINQQTAEGAWNEAKGKMRERWGELTDSEMSEAQGNIEQFTGYIQRKTGETREAIENYFEEIGAVSAWNQAKENVTNMAERTAENVQQTAQQSAEQVKAGYIQTQQMVKRHPMEAMAVTLGVGVVAGVVAGLMMRSK